MPVSNWNRDSIIVCVGDPPMTEAGQHIFDQTTSHANDLVPCSEHRGDVRTPKSMARFRNAFDFDHVVCFDCFMQAVKDGKWDNTLRARGGTLLTTPGFLGAGEWAMHTGGQGRYRINKSGDITVAKS